MVMKPFPRQSRPSGVNDSELHCEVSVNGAGARSIARLKRPGYQNSSLSERLSGKSASCRIEVPAHPGRQTR